MKGKLAVRVRQGQESWLVRALVRVLALVLVPALVRVLARVLAWVLALMLVYLSISAVSQLKNTPRQNE